MKPFDQRWRTIVQAARRADRPWPEPGGAPVGWQHRARPPREEDTSELAAWWRWYGGRGLVAALAVFGVCVVFAALGPGEAPSLRPGIEDAVAEVLWLL